MNDNIKQISKIPEPSLRRLPWYLSCVKLKAKDGDKYISSTQISRKTGIDASQIAKDMSYISISGRTRVGYDVAELIRVLEEFLGFTSCHNAFICGVGSLGGALLGDSGLMHFGLHIVAGFDVDPKLVGHTISGVPIYHMDDLKRYVSKHHVQIGVLTVPIDKAQKVTNQMTKSGIKAVWNFTPFRIRVPEGIVVQNTSLYAHLAVMFNRLNSQNIENDNSHKIALDDQE